MRQIELKKFLKEESRVFTGRNNGQEARRRLNLDELDASKEQVEIIIPDDTLSVNSSFFSGMFQKSLKKLGETAFRKKYIFKCNKSLIIDVNIEKNIRMCLLMLNSDFDEV